MKQAIAGVVPAEEREVTIMTVWPSVALYGMGRMLGQLFAIQFGWYIFKVGNLIALASIPITLPLFLMRVAPGVGIRYRLTNRRIIVERGLNAVAERSLDLDRFDAVDIIVQPGQAWYHAGDLVLRKGNVETFRLEAVSRPESFRAVLMKANQGYVGVKEALAK